MFLVLVSSFLSFEKINLELWENMFGNFLFYFWWRGFALALSNGAMVIGFLCTYFIAILQWSIVHLSSASIDGGFWLKLVFRQMIFFRILIRCGKFHFDFFVECVQSNHIFFALSLHLFLTVQFFPTALRWILFAIKIN